MFSGGCEDGESGNGEQYGEFAIGMFILDKTGDAQKNEIIFTKCQICTITVLSTFTCLCTADYQYYLS